MKPLYSTKVTALGGRNGHVRSDDSLLDLTLAMPAALGGTGGASNPEQLFAAGYAACFESALMLVAKGKGVELAPADVEIAATIGLVPNGAGGFALTAALDIAIAAGSTGLDQAKAQELAEAAHAVCPYSNAIRGNIEVPLHVTTR
ncbi:organic hydroperoxide resistance protein [Novosphingobium sp. 1949]|uniref:Organic hydroperoxide resistance protein n=1 Tax=Novosphingobium organovorum TaxID=2930092 RepID=A0ABT0BFQ3_9SPHN|nr:organic hydroperoxide resistance protein [Novosphingobium organovorum]MCJ2183851.1 organic hydroperoxide resistance protein [Novosphingobium organovorum]